ncbi:hypothetical protein V3396_06615 [Pseudomonas aeruginosa]|uniref:hypothetical protein n=1 Tax=Pseudomonas aeruginosa TaxID=287 RepID=UPI0015DA5CC3
MTIKRKLYHFHFCCGLGGVAAGMSLRDALTTPRQQPKPGRRHPWNHRSPWA